MIGMESIKEIVGRMARDPYDISALMVEMSNANDELRSHLDVIQQREVTFAASVADRKKNDGSAVFPLPAQRQAEICRLLKADAEYLRAKEGARNLKDKLCDLDSTLESMKRRNDSDQKLIALLTAFIGAGESSNVQAILAAYTGDEYETASYATETARIEETPTQPSMENPEMSDHQTLTVTVIEARQANNPNTVRAFCQMEDGSRVAIFAKNGNGKMLQNSIEKRVVVECSKVDRGLFAYKVSPAA